MKPPTRKQKQSRNTTRNNTIQSNLSHSIWKYNVINDTELSRSFHRVQFGGGDFITIHGIDVWENEDTNAIAIFGGKWKKIPYIIMIFDSITKEMSLNSFSTDRIVQGHIPNDSIADILIRVVYDICKRKHASRLVLQDNTKKICKLNGKHFRLMDVYFLSHGITWYESKFKGLQPDNKMIERYRKEVVKNTWDEVVSIINLYYPDITEQLKTVIDNIRPISFSTSESGSAMKVFRLMKDRRMCEPFTDLIDYFLLGSKIQSLHSSTWYLEL